MSPHSDPAGLEGANLGAGCRSRLFWDLAVRDIQDAVDVLRAVHDASDGTDGFVSLELPPRLSRDTDGSVEFGAALLARLDRPNVMVPASTETLGVDRFGLSAAGRRHLTRWACAAHPANRLRMRTSSLLGRQHGRAGVVDTDPHGPGPLTAGPVQLGVGDHVGAPCRAPAKESAVNTASCG